MMNSVLVRSLLLATATVGGHTPADEKAAFVTTLGRDTIALESFSRSATRVEGDILVRIPGTVLCHYMLELASDGRVTKSVLDVEPMGTSTLPERHVTLEFAGDSLRAEVDSAGHRGKRLRLVGQGCVPDVHDRLRRLVWIVFLARRLRGAPAETHGRSRFDRCASVNMATGRTVPRIFVRRSPTQVDVDYFKIAWTHLTVDAEGHVTSADGSETIEKVQSRRIEFMDVPQAAKQFAAADKAGKGLGLASPNVIAKGDVGGQTVVVTYGSPRRRDRVFLGAVIPYDKVWRTGANAATVMQFDKPMRIGSTTLPAGSYSLWTMPKKDGTVDLIINSQHGQYGTDYDASHDIVHIPMAVGTSSAHREAFTIAVSKSELSMAWDTFVWSIPIATM